MLYYINTKMSGTDNDYIEQLLNDTVDVPLTKFEKKELLYLTDLNLGNYNGQSIRFNTQRWLDNLMLYPNSYIRFYLVATGTPTTLQLETAGIVELDAVTFVASATNTDRLLSLKNFNATLVNSVNLKLNGTTLQNSSDMHWHNMYRSLSEFSKDYSESTGIMHGYALDKTDINDHATNSGFATRASLNNYRVTIVQAAGPFANITAGRAALCQVRVEFEVNISIANISDFFAQLGVPLQNANFDLSLNLNGLKNASGNASNFNMLAVNKDVTAPFELTIDPSYPARWYAQKVTLQLEDVEVLASQLKETKTIQVAWKDTQVVYNTNPSNQRLQQLVIAPSIRRPTKVISHFQPISGGVERWLNQNVAYPQVTAHGISSERALLYPASHTGLTNLNLRVDSQKIYSENIDTPFEFYQMFRDSTLAASDHKQIGSLVSYKDFINFYNYYVVDLTKTAYRITDKPVSLEIIADKVNPSVNARLVHVIELDTITILNINDNNVVISNVGTQ